jgi:hypothetical protein
MSAAGEAKARRARRRAIAHEADARRFAMFVADDEAEAAQ